MQNRIHLIGNAHIDPVWLWRWQEGYAEIKATFRSALDRIEEFPGFIFTSACAAYYKWIEENEPEMFEEIRQRVSEGRWYITGGMWIQPDCNVPSGESFARHFLLSQRYFLEKFGVCATAGYNVDSFGHTGSLPKLFQAAGIGGYVMMRPSSAENPNIPFGAFWWESDDGSRVLTFRVDETTSYGWGLDYNAYENFEDWPQVRRVRHCANEADRLGIPFMCFYGVGNHGGGPTIQTLRQICQMREMKDGDRLVFSHPGKYFDEMGERDLPVWKTDLQHHASGCYSANSEIKRNNRRAENRLVQAEKFISLAGSLTGYQAPERQLEKAWQGVLFNQFHDIMGGCCIREAYEDARELHGQALSLAAEASNAAVQSISWAIDTMDENRTCRSKESDGVLWEYGNMGAPVVVFNSLSWARKIPVLIGKPLKSVTDDGGNNLAVQPVRAARTNNDDKWDSLFVAGVPAMGYAVYWIYLNKSDEKQHPSDLRAEGSVIENKLLRLEIDPDTGCIKSLYDKANEKEVFSAPAAAPLVIDIGPCDTWAHMIFSFRDVCGTFGNATVTVVENGPVRARLRVRSEYRESVLIQDFMLYEHSKEILVSVSLDWREKLRLLKLSFPVNIENGRASYDIPFGTIEKPADGTEEPGQMWFDLSNAEYGLSVLNNGKYSFDALDNDMRMTAANGSIYADHYAGENRDEFCEFQDQGIQRFNYSLYPHRGGWNAGVVKAAIELNTEETHINETYHEGTLPRQYEGISVSAGSVIATALKPAYDGNGYVLRLCEYEGKDVSCEIELPSLSRKFNAVIPKYSIKSYYIPANMKQNIAECDLREIMS